MYKDNRLELGLDASKKKEGVEKERITISKRCKLVVDRGG